jgi:filamentous hemagglutinin family protein
MKLFTLFASLSVLCPFAGILHAQGPVLSTPGTATWTTEATANGGTRTVFNLTKDTVFDWQQLNLKNGSEMVFNFTGGKTVVNFLGGTKTHRIDGSVTSNGNVAFFSPTADLQVNGSIIAKGVTLATLNADAADVSDGDGFRMSGKGDYIYLTVNGRVEATDGDVVLGGVRVKVGGSAKLQASRDVLIGGGREISVAASGDRRLKEESGFGFVLHLGETRASRIEMVAGSEMRNQGTINGQNSQIFLKVDDDGSIANESTGVIVANADIDGDYTPSGPVLVTDTDGDAAPAINEGTLTLPKLSRPDGTKVNSEPQTIKYTVPMSATGDARRDSGHSKRVNTQQMAQNDATRSLLQRSSFFGMRGGKTTIAKR